MQIQDPTSGKIALLSNDGQITTQSESHELQHHVSRHHENTYQVLSIDTGITAKTQTIMHMQNDSSTHICVISFMRVQAVGLSASVPAVTDYIECGFGRTVASGGTASTPVNMNVGSGKTAPVTCTGIDPTMAGTFTPIDSWYIEADGKEQKYDKQGSLILNLNDTFETRFVSSGTGECKVRVTFMMIQPGGNG